METYKGITLILVVILLVLLLVFIGVSKLSFQKIVVIIAIVILIILLIFVGVVIKNHGTKNEWPPVIGDCPDYWIDSDASGNGTRCINIKDLGTCPAATGQPHLVMDFNTNLYSGANGMCAKYKWAQNCNISWDGITYGTITTPCETTTTTTST
jgi:hypothetical protein